MDILLAGIRGTIEGKAIIVIATLALLDFVTGSLRAIQSGQFSLDAFATWVRVSLIHVVIVALVIIVGKALGPIEIVPGVTIDPISWSGLAAAASFAATTVKSILDNLNPGVRDVVPPPAT